MDYGYIREGSLSVMLWALTRRRPRRGERTSSSLLSPTVQSRREVGRPRYIYLRPSTYFSYMY